MLHWSGVNHPIQPVTSQSLYLDGLTQMYVHSGKVPHPSRRIFFFFFFLGGGGGGLWLPHPLILPRPTGGSDTGYRGILYLYPVSCSMKGGGSNEMQNSHIATRLKIAECTGQLFRTQDCIQSHDCKIVGVI